MVSLFIMAGMRANESSMRVQKKIALILQTTCHIWIWQIYESMRATF